MALTAFLAADALREIEAHVAVVLGRGVFMSESLFAWSEDNPAIVFLVRGEWFVLPFASRMATAYLISGTLLLGAAVVWTKRMSFARAGLVTVASIAVALLLAQVRLLAACAVWASVGADGGTIAYSWWAGLLDLGLFVGVATGSLPLFFGARTRSVEAARIEG